MTVLSDFEKNVLNASRDDYEAPHTIAADLSRDLGRAVDEHEVMSAFVRIANLGLVQAFEFDATAQRFLPVMSRHYQA